MALVNAGRIHDQHQCHSRTGCRSLPATSPWAARQLTERIQREFGVSYERAENIKTGANIEGIDLEKINYIFKMACRNLCAGDQADPGLLPVHHGQREYREDLHERWIQQDTRSRQAAGETDGDPRGDGQSLQQHQMGRSECLTRNTWPISHHRWLWPWALH
ncbi:MAG: hypothetical protein MZV70_37245 [Desulfobacterales bacterium]|nr:hypothetical protein [Desulfobacterales bacterium]